MTESEPFNHNDNRIYPESLVEPETHVRNTSFYEKFISCCFPLYDLSPTELRLFWKLRYDVNEPFDKNNSDHHDLILRIWRQFFQTDPPLEFKSEKWKEMGFQNSDPRTDIRGGGLYSMKCLSSYLAQYPERAKTMAYSECDFLLAVCSINTSFHLKKYFHLADFLDFKINRNEICSRKALKNFCSMLIQSDDTFLDLHHSFYHKLFDQWISVRNSNQKVTLLDFGESFLKVCKAFDSTMNRRFYKDVNDFDVVFNSYF